ncbi:MAG: protein-disulfide reductase DsbD family protein, partial [Lamprobacter sp.]|uniref:protein-disulfide reductase DsbD domain-containing protein n=1 Tax=Lamprobacter sp. TaxID=3100796 RepID=UPI002B25E752
MPTHRYLLHTLFLLLVVTLLPIQPGAQAQPAGSALDPVGSARNNPFAAAQAEAQFLPVDQAYQLEVVVEDRQQLRLYWQIADGYYLYQHKIDAQLQSADGPVGSQLSLPTAQPMVDEFFGEVSVYYYNADVRMQLDTAVNEGLLSVSSQGCADAGLCYPPRTQQYRIDFDTGAVEEQAPAKP